MGKDVSDGCLYHVCLKVDAPLVLAAHDGKQMKLLSETVIASKKSKSSFEAACMAEMNEGLKVDAAREKIEELLKISLRPILSAIDIPKLIADSSGLEFRLLLCRTESIAEPA
jgi:hypothetical protein